MAEPRTVRENANTLSSVQIAEILPHRYPFALVDRILDYEPGQWAIGRKCVTRNEEFFNGHFPAQPVMPGVPASTPRWWATVPTAMPTTSPLRPPAVQEPSTA